MPTVLVGGERRGVASVAAVAVDSFVAPLKGLIEVAGGGGTGF
jgi:hypothetical protein